MAYMLRRGALKGNIYRGTHGGDQDSDSSIGMTT